MKNVLEFIETSAVLFPEKTAFLDTSGRLTYTMLLQQAKKIGTCLARLKQKNRPVAVYMNKSVRVSAAMFGAVYSGNFYVVIDSEMPAARINKIFETLNPVAVITEHELLENAEKLDFSGEIHLFSEMLKEEADEQILTEIRMGQIDTDPLYALFTSGSTGVPKGAVVSHRSVIAYSEWFSNAFDIREDTVFGNQTPFYFSMSVSDIYATIRNGATLAIIPKIYFAFPVKLIAFLNENRVNAIYWVPSALSIVANLNVFQYCKPAFLEKVLFAGEVMPTKQLNYWIAHLGDEIMYANLYGPTESTDICTYYVVDRTFRDDEPLPIGRHCDNCDVMIVKKDHTPAQIGEEGELYARGSFLALGYYNNPDKTADAFVQNPLNPCYPEPVYKTGDLVKMNERGEILYITRKDFQIKHMGYRIELGEIETAAGSMQAMEECAALFNGEKDVIVLIYQGKKLDDLQVMTYLRTKLSSYLLPGKLIQLKQMPHNQNGKIDRAYLKTIL